jgi:N-acetylmuramoyl-L-alanine amidase
MRLILDPGHGGLDEGTHHGNLVEKDYNLMMARLCRQALLGLGWGLDVALTRDDDTDTSLRARGQVAKEHRPDLVLSLHVNASNDDRAQGAIIFVKGGDQVALKTATAIQTALPEEVRRSVNWLFYANPVGWLSRAWNVLDVYDCPAVLLEMGFATNADDRAQLLSTSVQRGIVAAVVAGVARADGVRVGAVV